MNREQAWELLNEYTKNESLLKHALAVEAGMRFYARKLGQDEERWGMIGLLHDFDYERFPEPPQHTREGAKILREKGYDEDFVNCVMSHAEWNVQEYPRDRPERKVLYAVDELCGFIVACALVRPERLEGMKPKSVKKKMKSKAFAAAVSREDMVQGAELLELPLEEHITNCIEALRGAAGALGLE